MSMPATMAKRRVGAATSDEDAVSAQQKAAPPPLRRDGAHCCRILHRDRAQHICTVTWLTPTTSAPGPGSPVQHVRGTRPVVQAMALAAEAEAEAEAERKKEDKKRSCRMSGLGPAPHSLCALSIHGCAWLCVRMCVRTVCACVCAAEGRGGQHAAH